MTKPSGSEAHIPAGLRTADWQRYYEILSQNITDYDCGTLCAPLNEGVPLCCSVKKTVPLLYKSEFSYLQHLGDMWQAWQPVSKSEIRLSKALDRQEMYGKCKGARLCSRNERSISCRTFPLEPYIDEKGLLAGLVFVEDFRQKKKVAHNQCPLKNRKQDIRPEYIRSSLAFWKSFLRISIEYETYRHSSMLLRKKLAREGQGLELITDTPNPGL